MQLDKIVSKFAKEIANNTDAMVFQYVESSIDLIKAQGKNIEDYSLVCINNPMEFDDGHVSLRTTSQWRIVPNSQLKDAS